MKKTLISIGTISTVLAPAILAISCGNERTGNSDSSTSSVSEQTQEIQVFASSKTSTDFASALSKHQTNEEYKVTPDAKEKFFEIEEMKSKLGVDLSSEHYNETVFWVQKSEVDDNEDKIFRIFAYKKSNIKQMKDIMSSNDEDQISKKLKEIRQKQLDCDIFIVKTSDLEEDFNIEDAEAETIDYFLEMKWQTELIVKDIESTQGNLFERDKDGAIFTEDGKQYTANELGFDFEEDYLKAYQGELVFAYNEDDSTYSTDKTVAFDATLLYKNKKYGDVFKIKIKFN